MRYRGWVIALAVAVVGCSSTSPQADGTTTAAIVSVASTTTEELVVATTTSSTVPATTAATTTTVPSTTTTLPATTTTVAPVDDGTQHLHDCIVIALGGIGFLSGPLAAAGNLLDAQTANDSILYVAAFAHEPLNVPDDIRQALLQANAASQTATLSMAAATTDAERNQVIVQLGVDLKPVSDALDQYSAATCADPMASSVCKNGQGDGTPVVFTQPEHTEAYYTELFEMSVALVAGIPGCAERFIAPDGSREHPYESIVVPCTGDIEGAIGLGGDSLVVCTGGEWIPTT